MRAVVKAQYDWNTVIKFHFWSKRLSGSEFLGQDTPKSYIISRWLIPTILTKKYAANSQQYCHNFRMVSDQAVDKLHIGRCLYNTCQNHSHIAQRKLSIS